MRTCSECEKEFSDKDVVCPHCGAINVDGDFTLDTNGFWDAYEKYIDNHIAVLNGGNHGKPSFVDPDAESKQLAECHKEVWSKSIGEVLEFKKDDDSKYILTCKNPNILKNIRLSSDIIATSLIGYDWQCRSMLKAVKDDLLEQNYRAYILGYTRKFYTNIGSFIIFPKMQNGINTTRGDYKLPIKDRFDLTLECIRIYYDNLEKSPQSRKEYPLRKVFEKDINVEFFNLFGSFKKYVDYFYLQDLLKKDATGKTDYNRVDFWLGDGNFDDALPKDEKEYKRFMENQLAFVEKRTKRIKQAVKEQWEKQNK